MPTESMYPRKNTPSACEGHIRPRNRIHLFAHAILFGLILAIGASLQDASAATQLESRGQAAPQAGAPAPGDCTVLSPGCTWEKVVGGPLPDKAYAVAEMADGGFTVAGHSRSRGRTRYDAAVVRFDRAGQVIWQMIFGGPETEQLYAVVPFADGGVAVAGHKWSYGRGKSDVWIVRLDDGGHILWEKTLGGPENDRARTMAMTRDGGLVVAGFTRSKGAGDGDAWIIRLSPAGDILWDRTYGRHRNDGAFNITALPDGGFAVGGYSQALASQDFEAWLLLLDDEGRLEREQRFQRGHFAAATGVTPAADGGLYIAGLSEKTVRDRPEVMILRLDVDGGIVWEKHIGGPKSDGGWSVAGTTDDGLVVLAASASRGAGSTDAWLMRFDQDGTLAWERVYGRQLWDRPTAVLSTKDGGLVVTGYTTSQGAQQEDIWLLRLDNEGRLEVAEEE